MQQPYCQKVMWLKSSTFSLSLTQNNEYKYMIYSVDMLAVDFVIVSTKLCYSVY
jgi:hypothetical protein